VDAAQIRIRMTSFFPCRKKAVDAAHDKKSRDAAGAAARASRKGDPTNPKRVWYSGVLSSRMGYIELPQ